MAASQGNILTFLNSCSQAITARARLPQEVQGARVLAERLVAATPLPFKPSWQPALHGIHAVHDTPLAQDFVHVASLLPWVPTLKGGDGGAAFARVPLSEMFDFGGATVGILYIKAGAQFPPHRHKPQELYYIISGQGLWRWGGNTQPQPVGPGEVLYNNPYDYHFAISGESPVVALYCLW